MHSTLQLMWLLKNKGLAKMIVMDKLTELKCSGMLLHQQLVSGLAHDFNFCDFVLAVWIAVKFGTDIHVLVLINVKHFGEPLVFL